MPGQDRANELEERLIDFAARITMLSDSLPNTRAGNHYGGQILRCGTSPAPNYGEARGAESRADFKHKLGIVSKELNETVIWLKIMIRAKLVSMKRVAGLLDEGQQLARIVTASVATVRTDRNKMTNEKRQVKNEK